VRAPVLLHASRLLCTVLAPAEATTKQAERADSRELYAEPAVVAASALDETEVASEKEKVALESDDAAAVLDGDNAAGTPSSQDDYEDDAFYAAAQDSADVEGISDGTIVREDLTDLAEVEEGALAAAEEYEEADEYVYDEYAAEGGGRV